MTDLASPVVTIDTDSEPGSWARHIADTACMVRSINHTPNSSPSNLSEAGNGGVGFDHHGEFNK